MDQYQQYINEAMRLATILGLDNKDVPANIVPWEGYFIRSSGNVLEYVYTERGAEDCKATEDLQELLYWVFRSITFTMASEYEAKHRIQGEDFRRQLFTHHAALLFKLNPLWAQKVTEEYDGILKKNPYCD